MRETHTPVGVNLDLLRAFFSVAELGSLSKAAERMRVSQSTLTRQMNSLEQEVGGALLERGPGGVALTATGHELIDGAKPLLEEFDRVFTTVKLRARGQSAELRVGYLLSAAPTYLHPALAQLRKEHPEVRVTLVDLSPGEQIRALGKGEIDIGLIGQAGAFLTKEFYVRRIATLPVIVAISETHPLAKRKSLKLADLRGEMFVGAPDVDVPGYNRWVMQLCRKAGFRARFVQDADSLSHGLSLVVSDNAVSLNPVYVERLPVPGVIHLPLTDAVAKWELNIVWQRGRMTEPVKALLEALPKPPAAKS